jgi:hypothetical protein
MLLSHRARVSLPTLFALVLVGLVGFDATADDLTTSGGKKSSGKLTAIDAQNVTFTINNAKVTVPNREIVVVSFGNDPLPAPKETFSEIELTDGSTLKVAKFLLKGKKFEVDTLPPKMGQSAPTYDLPLRSVFSAMKRADDAKQRENWKKMLATRGKRDLYVIAREEGLTYVQGTIQEGLPDGSKLKFQPEGDGAAEELPQSRSAGLVFYQAQPATIAPTLCRVFDVYGNSLNATAISLSMDGSVTVVTVSGASVKYPSTASLSKLDFAGGNVAYLSDLDPQVERPEIAPEEMKLNPVVAYLKDRSLSNDGIKLDSVTYQKGLCVAPDTVLTYNLGGDYSQFRATAGIDENGANATSAAKLTIEADGQVLFSGTLNRKEKPKGLVLAVKGVKQLKVIVEADTPLNGNYITLAEANVQK